MLNFLLWLLFLWGLQFNSCFPPSLKHHFGSESENILFHFSRTVVGRTWSTSALIFSPLIQPPPLSRLFLTSGPVKPLAGGEMEGVWLLDAVCAFMRAHECLCMHTPQSAFVSIRQVCACAVFKPTVSKALQDSPCIIGDLLLSAHCIWQLWIGDCHADMLINDNHNWYLLIAQDEQSGTAVRKKSQNHEQMQTFCTHLWLKGCVWVFTCRSFIP